MSNVRESELQRRLLDEYARHLPELRLFRRMVGKADVGGREIAFGIRGQSDLYGYWQGGAAVEVELKSATGSLREEQKRWIAWCERWGVCAVVLQAKRDETVDETVARWITELRQARP